MTDGSYAGLDDATILARLRPAPGTADAHDAARAAAEDAAPRGRAARAGGVELRVRVSTLLGRDAHPGELPGWGPIHAELARDLATRLTGARWVFAITDTDGRLLHTGITRRRPAGSPCEARSRHVIELQIPETLLRELAARDDIGPWAPVLADLARQYARRVADPYTADTDRRVPGAALRRHLQIRDRTCIGPGCRATARSADQDHTIDHDHGGTTTEDNLAPACRHDHRLKHDGGWRLEQPRPGYFTWTSRLGHRYHIRPPGIIEPLPDPRPGDRPLDCFYRTIDDPGPTLEQPPPEPEPPPEHDPADDIPQF